jgi:hypothetical protein
MDKKEKVEFFNRNCDKKCTFWNDPTMQVESKLSGLKVTDDGIICFITKESKEFLFAEEEQIPKPNIEDLIGKRFKHNYKELYILVTAVDTKKDLIHIKGDWVTFDWFLGVYTEI